MLEAQVHHGLVLLTFALSALTFFVLLRVNAPYGRFARAGWGPSVPAQSAWIVFESPAVVVFALIYFAGDHALQFVPVVFLGIWQFHYIVRAFIFPLRMRNAGKRIPVIIVVVAFTFNVLNAYINARWISQFGAYPEDWLSSAPFLVGLSIFAAGWTINQRADLALGRLREPGEARYSIPRRGLFRYISCPNYFGEILEWIGWAVLTWSLAGTAFAVFTMANLVPRALATHRWYQQTFPDYPVSRKAIFPFLV